ncbi:diaminohydroxyphosphoribosylaminopyrimidine deaminase/5-amino-6-(5-phosphoribosylamino)uracil reductase [Homoserinimonas aerilata]|uniref:Riboflavin biosynthesis protein RibD n=1 Tax=Homoserinimonas aerilata TaxID=1162970 RepID=A0A542YKU5_9MICO|nr:bifunctional diaminohydroxyphosphoribosylaminopyrimidine deaminase/5-amino-6-(5-phosphoribosylamino)uracil reductase RibD [Homoserinimonas aerilata]TQL48712.1 diaminohydroxyphosphoribosylaminopyrimidine deaminase/5-amino-6-(5-phosphoribosylamino)uracil reductase [Homoserinimonas aerilata]
MTDTANTAGDTIASAMRHALSLAAHGPAWGVNPQVGCVILDSDGNRIAEGWHRGTGTAHAEVDALGSLQPGQARGATAVVTLEPCNHTGRTGPCSEALIAAGVTRVVYAVGDPGAESGGGAARLREAGIAVTGGVLAPEAEEAMHPWLTTVRNGRPYVTVKWASSLDGRASAADGTSQWITGAAARQRVHEQRAASDAIAVGTGTVLSDDPALTARGDGGELMPHQPVPVVIGTRRIPADARVLQHPQPAIVTHSRDLNAVLSGLFARGIRSLYVEGGPTLASAFIAAGLVDEYAIFQGAVLLGGGRPAVTGIGVGTIGEARRLRVHDVEVLGEDVLIVARERDED